MARRPAHRSGSCQHVGHERAYNIELLGEAIGLELEDEAQENGVGPFRADILCRDAMDGHYVLIENQIERTDHGHLGQLLRYGAGLDAVTIVWVASRFTDEHRAAVDWLSNTTRRDIGLFGLEIESWRIGDSRMAPKFNVVSQPNDWSETVREQAAIIHAGSSLRRSGAISSSGPSSGAILRRSAARSSRTGRRRMIGRISLGRSDFSLVLFNNFEDGRSGVYLSLTCVHGKARYRLLEDIHR